MLKIKNRKDKRQHRKRGFSLIELVVIIAIMAIIAALLVPVLLRYTEDSRAQKDVSTMDEVVNAVQLAMADSNCYDEMIRYSCDNNFITYTDSSGKYGQQIVDAEYWAPDGCGRGVTITFNPEKNSQGDTIYRLENAIVNDMTYGNGSIAPSRQMQGSVLANNQCLLPNAKLSDNQDSGYLYNKIKATVGTSVITTSATYANSSFTIFIKFSQKDGVTVANVDGAFNGTNLTTDADAAIGSGTNSEIINPETGNKEQGEATTPNGGKNKNNYTASALQGSGSMPGGVTNINNNINDYQQPNYVDNLQKEHKFEYYSSGWLASRDVSAQTIGKNADCDKSDAVAGIYIDESGTPTVVILKDNHEEERMQFTVKANLILGGHKLTYNTTEAGGIKANVCVDMFNGGYIDGRIEGSELINSSQVTDIKTGTLQLSGNVIVNGGTYTISNSYIGANILTIQYTAGTKSDITIKNANIYTYTSSKPSVSNNLCNSIQVGLSGYSIGKVTCTVEDSEITSICEGRSANGINVLGSSLILKNTKINCYAKVWKDSETVGGVAIRLPGASEAEIDGCDLFGTMTGAIVHASEAKINNSKLSGYYMGGLYAGNTSNVLSTNSTLSFVDIDSKYKILTDSSLAAINISSSTAKFDNCTFAGSKFGIYTIGNATIYLSMCYSNATKHHATSGSTIYLGLRNSITKDAFDLPSRIIETTERYNQ